MNPEPDEIKEWLLIAEDDLVSAQILLSHEPPGLRVACFLCQQSIEKMLKAFLVWKNEPFEKTHNINYLLDLCKIHGLEIAFLRDKAGILTSYAVEVRYPGDNIEVTREEAGEALSIADAVSKLINDLIRI
ncbi:MAG: HEPN domain-containing protein [Candidatus Poribacteria bacterium]